jgi:hypothetical protein
MRAGPSKTLEMLVGIVIPPACREEVLGDLYERFKSPTQYLADALCVVPFVILSRIRRTTDLQVLVMEGLLLYASFVSAAWFENRALVGKQWIPAAIGLIVLLLDDVWAAPRDRMFPPSIRGVALGAGFACLSQAGVLPIWINLLSGVVSLVLISGVRILFSTGRMLK